MKIGWSKLFHLCLLVGLQCLLFSSLVTDRLQAQNIELSKTDLDFHVRSMKLSPNGKALVAWGGAKRSPAYSMTNSGPSFIAVVDTQTGKVIAQKEIPKGLRDVEIDDRFVFFAPGSGNLFYRVTHDLSDFKRLFVRSTPMQLMKISPSTLMIRGSRIEMFDVEKMTAIPGGDSQDTQANGAMGGFGAGAGGSYGGGMGGMGGRTSGSVPVANEVKLDGKIIDRASGELLRIESSTLPRSDQGQNAWNPLAAKSQENILKSWGRRISDQGWLSDHRGGQIARFSNVLAAVVNEDLPVGILVNRTIKDRRNQLHLQFIALTDGAKLLSTVIQDSNLSGPGSDGMGMGSGLGMGGGMGMMGGGAFRGTDRVLIAKERDVYIAFGKQVLSAKMPQNIVKDLVAPPHFLKKQQIVFDMTRQSKFMLGVGGSKRNVTYSLLKEYPGIELDARTGEIEVEQDIIWKALQNRASRITSEGRLGDAGTPKELEPKVNAEVFRKLTGKSLPAGKFAMSLPISVNLRDSEGQEDAIEFQVIALGPAETIAKAVNDALDRKKAAQEENRKRQMAQQRNQGFGFPPQNVGSKTVDERLNEMDARLRRLEAALDSVLKKLDEK